MKTSVHNNTSEQLQTLLSRDEGQRVVLDFDHTLLLANSTECFIAQAKPAFLVAPLLKLLGGVAPWKLGSGDGYFERRDLYRVVLVLLLAPWTIWLFKRRAPEIFAEKVNKQLDGMLADVSPSNISIVSFGLDFVIRAMLKGSRYESCELLAPSVKNLRSFRQRGKLAMLREANVQLDISRDIVVTDSEEHDSDLLGEFDNSFHLTWPGDSHEPAFNLAYIPFFYTANIKRSPEFLIKQVLLEEFPIVLLAFGLPMILLISSFWAQVNFLIVIAMLFAAFLVVYEIGYAENDRVGFQKEEMPKLSNAFYDYREYRLVPKAWYWAAFLTLSAFSILDPAMAASSVERLGLVTDSALKNTVLLSGLWLMISFVGRLAFFMFNHSPLQWRVYMYFPLHLIKYFALLFIFPSSPVGYALLAAHVSRTWMLYAIRRTGGDIERIASQTVRLFFFSMLLPVVAQFGDSENFLQQWPVWVVFAWCVIRALPELKRKILTIDAVKSGQRSFSSNALLAVAPERKKVAITMATMNRPKGLAAALASFAELQLKDSVELRVVVIDNSGDANAREYVEGLRQDFPFDLEYLHETTRGISFARNRGLQSVLDNHDDYMVFIDDDEWVDPNWIQEMCDVMDETAAAGIIGRVEYDYDESSAWWAQYVAKIEASDVADREMVDFGYTTNSMVSVKCLRDHNIKFEEKFALTGGEDTAFFKALLAESYKVVYSASAVSFEKMGSERQTFSWWLRRWYRTGNTEALIDLSSESRRSFYVGVFGLLRLLIGGVAAIVSLPMLLIGKPVVIKHIRKFSRGLGGLSSLFGVQYEEYLDHSR